MSQVKTGDTIAAVFTTQSPTTGAATNADSTPTGTLVINGVDNAAAVTVTNRATGDYKAAVTLPAVATADTVQILIAATVGGVSGKRVVWSSDGTTKRVPDLNDLAATAIVSGGAITTSGGKASADLQTIKTQSVTCGAAVTISPNVGTATAALVVDASGRVQVQYGTSPGQINLSGGDLAGAVPSVTGAVGSISGVTFPVNFSSLAITSGTGRVSVNDLGGIPVDTSFADYQGTVAANTGTTVTLKSGVTFATDSLRGRTFEVASNGGRGQMAIIKANTNADPPVVTLDRSLSGLTNGASTYEIGGLADVSLQAILGTTLTEGSTGLLGGNFSTFWGNGGVATLKTVDDVGTGSGGGGAAAAEIWDYLTSSISTTGSIGKLVKDNLNAPVSGVPVAVRDVDNTSPAVGSLGAKVNSASSAGDPWTANLPGSYGPGTAGFLLAYGTQSIHLNPGSPSPSVRRRP